MRHISLTVLVCMSVTVFATVYQRITKLLVRAILEGLARI
jgi:hypothetical protein